MTKMLEAPSTVHRHVRSYFADASNGVYNYNLLGIQRKFDETKIYRVLGRHKKNKKYAVWTCWNEDTQSMNFGHYDLELKEALDIFYCRGKSEE